MTTTGPDNLPGDEPAPQRRATRRMRIAIVVATVTGIALIAVLAVVLLRDTGSEPGVAPPPSASATPTASARTTPTPSPTPSNTSPRPTTTVTPFAYQALWPFSSDAGAAAWQRSYRSGGHQPWHLDPEQTALSFTTGYLGFTEIDRVVSRSVSGNEAWIGIGYQAEGRLAHAATLHLVRISQGPDAPWEVVGTIDTTLTLDRPGTARP
ncbi:hypothetical protein AB0E63_33270 [Kribbella sp. NPDC026596]|uniref:hypothetical protein n=1 Tax=Kribbella sp. NPDC026596 TaxID=3155122 RepID=UPI0033FD3D41